MSSTKVTREPNNIFAENIKPDRIRHVVNVTIETAKEFHNCNHLYVRYVVDAPAGSKLPNSLPMTLPTYYIHDSFIPENPKLFFSRLLLDWILAEPKNLHGVTHQSRAGNDSSNHFGHRFTLDVSKSWQHSSSSSSETPDLIPTPLLLLEVYDVNMWNRQKSVGYGFTHVPLTPGSYSIAIPTWRPYITETSLQLREYFLGLAPQIENIKYAGIPNNDVK